MTGEQEASKNDPDPTNIVPLPDKVEEIIEELPEDKRIAIREAFYMEMFRGPLPPPDMLAAYEEAHPGCAREILDMAKVDQRHAHTTITTIINANISIDRESSRVAAGLIAIFIIGSFVLVLTGHEAFGGVGLASSMATLIGMYIRTERRRDQSLEPPKPQLATPAQPAPSPRSK